ncbi:DUF1850 domain-containing protein [Fictibacillus aquaticus]|uniref:RocC n=1 Tax=Fictibacillus aquaticus TaxID=2021314 RepID=A0A235FF56_9BACL|nr:DUF1850 domain-containing protein [Fictibacillus aquaticus]OYD59567.1 hypothetical protein CGZ90_06660 [Fictibacillus aquaticus]
MKRLFLLTLTILLTAAVLFVPVKRALLFEEGKSGKLVAHQVIEDGEKFQIKYTHSIHKTPVIETYKASADLIIQQSIAYRNFGVGMPDNAGEGERFRKVDGMYVLDQMNREFPHLDLRTGKVIANHKLIVDGKERPFSSFAEPGSWLRIKLERISLWDILKGGNIVDN